MSSTVNVIILLFLSIRYVYSKGRSETYCIWAGFRNTEDYDGYSKSIN